MRHNREVDIPCSHSPSQVSDQSWQLEWSTGVMFCFLPEFVLKQPNPSVRGLKQTIGYHIYRWNTMILVELKKEIWAWNVTKFFHLYQIVLIKNKAFPANSASLCPHSMIAMEIFSLFSGPVLVKLFEIILDRGPVGNTNISYSLW